MKNLFYLVLATALLTTASTHAQDASAVSDARAATEQWLKLMDKEEYSAAWNASAAGVRNEMPKFAWTMLMSATHAPLGDFKSRVFQKTVVNQPAAGKPGEASISFEYASRYEKTARVQEVITSVHEKDGTWRVSGYGIHSDAH